MADLTKKFQIIMNDIESNISDEKELNYINKKIAEISMLYMDVIDEMTDILKTKIDKIEEKVGKIEKSVTGIENDMYEDGFDFEIICPYCNAEFIADVESKSNIKCPECQNTIELDWNGGEEINPCSGHCSSCSSKCGGSFFEEFGDDINLIDNETDDDDDF